MFFFLLFFSITKILHFTVYNTLFRRLFLRNLYSTLFYSINLVQNKNNNKKYIVYNTLEYNIYRKHSLTSINIQCIGFEKKERVM